MEENGGTPGNARKENANILQGGSPCKLVFVCIFLKIKHNRWEFNENTDKINFTIQSKNTDRKNKWTGIGFSDNPSMRLTDAIIGWVEPSGRYFLMDMWTTNYLSPILEPRQDITDKSGSLVEGVTHLKFTRARMLHLQTLRACT